MIATLSRNLFERLKRKAYRSAYVSEHVRTGVAYQIRALRDQRGWPQKKLAQEMNKPQSVVSRLEDPDYGKLSIQTLLEVADAFDVALLIQYVSYPDFLRRTRDVSGASMEADSFDEKQFRPMDKTSHAEEASISSAPSSGVLVGRFGFWDEGEMASSPFMGSQTVGELGYLNG